MEKTVIRNKFNLWIIFSIMSVSVVLFFMFIWGLTILVTTK
jgi:hypothetical protein